MKLRGVVGEVGQGVDRDLLGQPVVAMTRFGGHGEKVAVGANQIFEKPEALSFEQAAAIPVNYLTAYALLVVDGRFAKRRVGIDS